MRIRFRRKSRYEKARDAVKGVVRRVRQRFEREEEQEEDEPQRRTRVYYGRPALRIIIKD